MTPEFVTDTVTEWLLTLDYEYMLLHVIISYGLYYSDNMKWFSNKLGGLPYSIWWAGGILAAIEIIRFLPYFDGGFDTQKVVSILHSYFLIQVFVGDIVKIVHRWVELLRGKNNIK